MPSTVIRYFTYDEIEQTLTIEFVSGSRYQYLNVEKQLYEEFMLFREKGVFYNQRIKGKYEFVRLADNAKEQPG